LKHEFPPEWQKKTEAEYVKYAGPGKGRPEQRDEVRFTTYTLRYPGCDWVEILGLDRHYERAEVDARRKENEYTVKTANVRVLRLGLLGGDSAPHTVSIDGQQLSVRPGVSGGGLSLFLEKRDGRWRGVLPQIVQTDRLRRLQKLSGLQGPLGDAFVDSFLWVRGPTPASNPAPQQ